MSQTQSKRAKALQAALDLNRLYRQALADKSPGYKQYCYYSQSKLYTFLTPKEIRLKAIEIAREGMRDERQ